MASKEVIVCSPPSVAQVVAVVETMRVSATLAVLAVAQAAVITGKTVETAVPAP
jgi:hypothetical protein